MPMKTDEPSGLFIRYDKSTRKLTVFEQTVPFTYDDINRRLLEFSFSDISESNLYTTEHTLGQFILYSLEKLISGGLGFGNYANLFERICTENYETFFHGIDLSRDEDQYDLATMMFSRGRRIKSWEMIEQAIDLFTQAAKKGNSEAQRFLEEDLPIVRPRLEEKLKKKSA